MPDSARQHGDEDFPEDPRYKTSVREMAISLAYWVVTTTAIIGVAWALGGGKSAEEMDFVLGFPAWFFWSAFGGGVFMCVLAVFVVRRFFTDISLDAADPAEGTDARQEGSR